MTLRRRRAFRAARACLLVSSVLALAACGTVLAQHAKTAAAKTTPTTPTPVKTGRLPGFGCATPSPRYAWAVELTASGRTVWTTSLPTRNVAVSSTVEPVTDGAVALFAQDGIVYGLEAASGHRLWSWTGGQSVYGMWPDGGLVAVLTDQASNHARLTGLDAATGAIRWSLRLPRNGLYGGQALTADGGLAIVVAGGNGQRGILQVVNLADGRIRWQRRTGASAALVAADGMVIFGINGGLTGYDDRTGQPRWTIARGVPEGPDAQLTGGLVLLSANAQGPGISNTLTAVIPATGRVAWRFNPGAPVTVLSAGSAGLSLSTYDPARLYLLDPRTGRPRWQADAAVMPGTIPLITKTAVISAEGTAEGNGSASLVDRAAANGRVRWQDALPQLPNAGQQVIQAGPLALLQGSPQNKEGSPPPPALLSAYQLASGRLAWRAGLPAFVALAPVAVPDGILVQPADPTLECSLAG
jgi:outer membrane protein assembly factor BamB